MAATRGKEVMDPGLFPFLQRVLREVWRELATDVDDVGWCRGCGRSSARSSSTDAWRRSQE
eukprot:2602952-Rhodomonas_salina.1